MGLLDDAIREHLELKRRRGADAVDISRQESDALGPVRRGPDGAPDMPDTFQAPPDEVAPPLTEAAPWEGEATAAHSPVASDPAYEPPPYEPSALIPGEHARPEPEPEPPLPSEPAWRAYAAEVAPDPAAFAREPELPPYAEPEPESDPWSLGADPEPDPVMPADPPSRFGRLRIGRRKTEPPPPRVLPEPADADPTEESPRTSFAPPASPAGYEPPPPYEPPPLPPRSHGYDPPTVAHEPDIVPADDEGEAEDVLEETPDFLEETPEHDRLWFEQRPPRDFNFDD